MAIKADFLTWGLAIATYNRPSELVVCVTAALRQTYKPREIVICDSSPTASETRAQIERLVRYLAPDVRLAFPIPRRAQQTIQRNAAIDAATVDILFMIDDDTYMHPRCAEYFIETYKTFWSSNIVGVTCLQSHNWPISDESLARPLPVSTKLERLVANMSPYTWFRGRAGPCVKRPLHENSLPFQVSSTDFMLGALFTARRDAIAKIRFDEDLVTGLHEDADASLRLARSGLVCQIWLPLMHHAAAPRQGSQQRRSSLSRFSFLFNMAYFNLKNFGGRPRVRAHNVLVISWLLLLDFAQLMLRNNRGSLRALLLAWTSSVHISLLGRSTWRSFFLARTEDAIRRFET